MKETHSEWFKRVTRGDSNRQVANRAEVSDATLGRQIREGELKPDIIIRIAQAYDESPVIALVDLGFISARWMNEIGTTTALSRASDEELTDELLRRLRLIPNEPADDLAAKRSSAGTPDVQDLDYAADHRVPEPEEGDDDYGPGA